MENFDERIKAVIFDMDGVLIDTERFYFPYWREFFLKKSLDPLSISERDLFGGQAEKLIPRFFGFEQYSPEGQKLIDEASAFFMALDVPYEQLLFSDVRESLEKLVAAGYKIGLASSSSRDEINKVLSATHLEKYFDLIESGENFNESKPNPEIYQLAMAKLAVQPAETLVIEDSKVGIEAGKAAGAMVWAIEYRDVEIDQTEADLLIPNLSQMIKNLNLK